MVRPSPNQFQWQPHLTGSVCHVHINLLNQKVLDNRAPLGVNLAVLGIFCCEHTSYREREPTKTASLFWPCSLSWSDHKNSFSYLFFLFTILIKMVTGAGSIRVRWAIQGMQVGEQLKSEFTIINLKKLTSLCALVNFGK